MLHTFYNQGFTDALRHFHADAAKLAQFSMGGGAAGRSTSAAPAQPMTPPTMPPAAPGPAALPSAPVANPRTQPTL